MRTLISELAEELLEAEKTNQPISPITERHAALSVADSYHIQLEIVKRKLEEGKKIIGKKVGLTSKAMQDMLGVSEPDYGHLFDDMKVTDNEIINIHSMVAPKIEAEIGFILEEDLKGPNVTYLDVLMATKYVVPTIEVIDSRIADWKIKLVDTVADNGSSAKVVVGNKYSTIEQVRFTYD